MSTQTFGGKVFLLTGGDVQSVVSFDIILHNFKIFQNWDTNSQNCNKYAPNATGEKPYLAARHGPNLRHSLPADGTPAGQNRGWKLVHLGVSGAQ